MCLFFLVIQEFETSRKAWVVALGLARLFTVRIGMNPSPSEPLSDPQTAPGESGPLACALRDPVLSL